MKALETPYGGILYRSRTEARWAIFFDALQIRYYYEWEAFDLDGIKYLPDFYLPDQHLWIEIKGTYPTEFEQEKAARLLYHTDERVVICYGDIPYPAPCSGTLIEELQPGPRFLLFQLYLDHTIGISHKGAWSECLFCRKVDILDTVTRYPFPCTCFMQHRHITYADIMPRCLTPRLMSAYEKARSYRFV